MEASQTKTYSDHIMLYVMYEPCCSTEEQAHEMMWRHLVPFLAHELRLMHFKKRLRRTYQVHDIVVGTDGAASGEPPWTSFHLLHLSVVFKEKSECT